MIIEVKSVSTGYDKRQVIYNLSLDIDNGEFLLITGSNGSGKSTLLKLLCGIVPLWTGYIKYGGNILHSITKATPTYQLINMGIFYIPQKNALFEDASLEENIHFSLLHQNSYKSCKIKEDEIYSRIPLLREHRKQRVSQLSGGERKLLSLGMSMASCPKLLLFDEPLSGISEDNVNLVNSVLCEVHENGTTVAVVEHRITEIIKFVTRTVEIKNGKLITDGD